MKKLLQRNLKPPGSILFILLIILLSGCSVIDEAADEAFDSAINFEGIYENESGWQVELTTGSDNTGRAKFIKAGSQLWYSAAVGETFAQGMTRESDIKWRGYVREASGSGYLGWGDMIFAADVIGVFPDDGPSYNLTKVGSGGTGGSSGGSGTSEVVVNQCVEGNNQDKKTYKITVPSSVKKLEIIATETQGSCDYNLADMFVRKGSAPSVSTASGYTWTADCASVNSNREDETCSFDNPGSGEWYIMLYGYNSSFMTNLKVIYHY